MAKKTAQIIIDVQDQSLQELNEQIRTLEGSIDSLKIGTEEWVQANQRLGDLKREFTEATGEATKLQGQIDQIGTTQQIQSVVKLGSGMVGAFTVANGALSLLGENEAFEKMTAHAATLLSVMGGLQQVSELFNKDTLLGLKSVGQGFRSLVGKVKNASRSMKAALIGTGIGALVVGVGLLIANWDKLTALIKRTDAKALKAAETRLQLAEGELELAKEQTAQQKLLLDQEELLNNTRTEQYNTAVKTYELGKLTLEEKIKELEVQEALIDKSIADYNKRLKGARLERIEAEKMYKLRIQELEAIDDRSKKEERQLNRQRHWLEQVQKRIKEKDREVIIERDLAIEQKKTLEREIEFLKAQQESNEFAVELAESLEGATRSVADLENQLTEVNAKLYSAQESYEIQVQILEKQRGILERTTDLNGQISDETQKQIDALNSQITALGTANDIRLEGLTLENALLENEINRNKALEEYTFKLYENVLQRQEAINDEEKLSEIYEGRSALLQMDIDAFEEGKAVRDEIIGFEQLRRKLIEERLVAVTKNNESELRITEEKYREIEGFVESYKESLDLKEFDFFAEKIKEYSAEFISGTEEGVQLTEKAFEDRSKYAQQLITDAATELSLRKIGMELLNDTLLQQTGFINDQLVSAQNLRDLANEGLQDLIDQRDQIDPTEALKELEWELRILNMELEAGVDVEEERLAVIARIEKLRSIEPTRLQKVMKMLEDGNLTEEKRNTLLLEANDLLLLYQDYQNEIFSTKQEIVNQDKEIERLEEKLVDTNAEIKKNTVDWENAQSKVTRELRNSLRFMERFNKFLEKNNEIIAFALETFQALGDFVLSVMEKQAVALDELAIDQQELADAALENQEEINKAIQEEIDLYKEASKQRLSDIEKLKKQQADANGERYAQIEAEILALEELEKTEKEALENKKDDERELWEAQEQARVDALNLQMEYEYQAAVNRKKQSIIDTIIGATVAAVSALPNFIASALIVAAGIAGVATISSQEVRKPEPIQPADPPFKEGGFTGFGDEEEEAGIVHKGEYVVPKWMMESETAQPHLKALEEQRKRGYQEGGYVSPVSPVVQSDFEYDRLIDGFARAVSDLPNPQVGLVNISKGLKDVELTKQEAGLTR